MIKPLKIIISVVLCLFMLTFPVFATVYIEDAPTQQRFPPARVIVTGFSVNGGGLIAGEVSTVEFVLFNTSTNTAVTSVLLTGWIDSIAPVEFTETNQAFIRRIPPGGEAVVTFEYFTRNVDMTAIGTVSAGFSIHYSEELSGLDRSNTVSLNLPVLRRARTTVNDEDMFWPAPFVSDLDRFLVSRTMQTVYVGGFVLCGILIVIILLFKLGILRFKEAQYKK